MTRIEVLTLQGNRISVIPSWICKMKGLKKLWLHNNVVTTIPSLADGEMRLEDLNLSFNKNLQSIPSLGKRLKELVIKGCDIRSLPHDLFHHGLQTVDMRNNKSESNWEFQSL